MFTSDFSAPWRKENSMHQVMTATRAHRNANPEYREASLDETVILHKDKGPERVRAAEIVAIGVGASEGMTRLALTGARHVDVDRKWFMAHNPYVGALYVQHADGSASVGHAAHIVALDVPQAEAQAETDKPAGLPSAADLDAVADDQKAAGATGNDAATE